MEWIALLFIALGLSVDSFAVSVSCGLARPSVCFRQAVPFALVMALFQGGMPVLGWLLGMEMGEKIGDFDHWLAFFLLLAVGIRMITDSIRKKNGEKVQTNPLKWNMALTLGLATSIDALVVGFSLGLIRIHIWKAAFLIGGGTFLASMLGMLLGKKSVLRFGNRLEIVGGIILILIGFSIFIDHQFLGG
ncbi:MAG TPA: manganese efflux pump [Bacteroidetes bacterium]|nr:manganese efflux pump [Bacteroidota bacterium]